MSARSVLLKTAGGLAAGAVAAVTTGVLVERRVVRARKGGAERAAEFGALRSEPREVIADDGVRLYAELDEVAPYAGDGAASEKGAPTLVFIHGYALNLDCWHFQREAFRGKYRMAFYDQRSHGRSGRGDRDHATIDQLGEDLRAVLDQLVPDGPVVLVGHSMGGMTIMAFADEHPDVFADRVAGVALISTTAGGLRPHRLLGRLLGRIVPDRLGEYAAPRLMATLAKAPELVDSARRGSNLGYLATDLFAFGTDVPAEEVEFVDRMLAGTSMSVIAEFFPSLSALDRFTALERLADIPTLILCGTADRVTSIGHSRKMAARLPSARLVESPGTGHMVIIEDHGRVDAEIDRLVQEARHD